MILIIHKDGASKVAIDTARVLKDSNKKVYFFSAVDKQEERIEGIEYISTNQNEALKEKNRVKGAINGIYNLKAKKELKKLLNTLDRETTILHVHGWTKALSSSIFSVAFKMKFKVVLTLHDYFTACPNGGYFDYQENQICNKKPLSWKCIKCNCDSRNYGFKLYRIIRQFVQNKIVKLNDKLENVITISEFSEKILKPTCGDNKNMIRIYNPIDVGEKEEKIDVEKNTYYLYVGRVSKEKGVDLFCQAITQLGYQGIVVGDGDEKEKLEKQYANIEFVGWKNKMEVRQYMKKAKVFVFPSRWYETMGMTVMEAMSLGIPVFVGDNCAAMEFVKDKETGMIYKMSSIEDLTKKLSACSDEDLKRMGENAYHLCWENPLSKGLYKEKIVELYERMMMEN